MSKKYNKSEAWLIAQARRKADRLLNAYNKYVADFEAKRKTWETKKWKPADTDILSYQDYLSQRDFLKSKKIAAGNITRKIISMQFYQISEASAERIMLKLKLLGIETIEGEKITIEKLKRGLNRAAITVINNALKTHGYADSYERAEWITETVYYDSL